MPTSHVPHYARTNCQRTSPTDLVRVYVASAWMSGFVQGKNNMGYLLTCHVSQLCHQHHAAEVEWWHCCQEAEAASSAASAASKTRMRLNPSNLRETCDEHQLMTVHLAVWISRLLTCPQKWRVEKAPFLDPNLKRNCGGCGAGGDVERGALSF